MPGNQPHLTEDTAAARIKPHAFNHHEDSGTTVLSVMRLAKMMA
jgi:hypothetical protein